jgi:hypothetical protein
VAALLAAIPFMVYVITVGIYTANIYYILLGVFGFIVATFSFVHVLCLRVILTADYVYVPVILGTLFSTRKTIRIYFSEIASIKLITMPQYIRFNCVNGKECAVYVKNYSKKRVLSIISEIEERVKSTKGEIKMSVKRPRVCTESVSDTIMYNPA